MKLPPLSNDLTHLDLSHNQLTSLPSEITKLANLVRLALSDNGLTDVPSEITKLSKLTSLDLSNNQLTSVPPEITKLTNLTYLNLHNNQLPISPETLSDPGDVKAIFAALAGLRTGKRLNEAKLLVLGDGKVGKSSVVERLLYDTFDPVKQTTLGVEINDEMQITQSESKRERRADQAKHLGFRRTGNPTFHPPVFSDDTQSVFVSSRCAQRRST